jgi:hypothetical protein
MRFNSTHDTCEAGDLSIPGGHCSTSLGPQPVETQEHYKFEDARK